MHEPSKEKSCKPSKILGGTAESFIPHGQVQKISQEGSKSTYMIILRKDCMSSNLSDIKSTGSGQGASTFQDYCATVVEEPRKSKPKVCDREIDSPAESEILLSRRKPCHKPEDVKLNLSNIDDEEYDSNQSASSVFLRQESGYVGQDSGIETDIFTYNFARVSDKGAMNTYFLKSPVSAPQTRKPAIEQHPLPLTSQDIGFVRPTTSDRQSAARKIVLVTPTAADGVTKSVLKKSVTYTHDAVPVIDKSSNPFLTPATLLPKNNPKAVPTFSNISPINQQFVRPLTSRFIPISPADSSSHSTSAGPLTSTPIYIEAKRRAHSKQDSDTHRPVYIIPSPFTRQNTHFLTQHSSSPVNPVYTPNLNNSSGFISGSSSLETPESSWSFEQTNVWSSDPVNNGSYNVDSSNEALEHVRLNRKSSLEVTDGSGGVVISMDNELESLDLGMESLTSSQESSDNGERSSGSVLNRSLTNIQWLKGMQLKEKEEQAAQSQPNPYQNVQWTLLSKEEIAKICGEFLEEKRPPFSYMALIQMALCSQPDRRMKLKEINQWIENTFPYYKQNERQGWKNSIRHNLSLYNIFEREKGKRHGSYWTLKSDVEPKTKSYMKLKPSNAETPDVQRSTPSLPSQIPLIPLHTSGSQLSAITPQAFHQSLNLPLPMYCNSKKKGPPPILPRPTSSNSAPYPAPQTYHLIPLGNMGDAFSPLHASGHMYFNLSGHTSACPSPIISEVSAAVASIQVSSASPVPPEQYCDPASLSQEHIYTKKPASIVKQAWIHSQTMESASSVDSDSLPNETASSSDVASSAELSGARNNTKRPRVRPGLPKPMMYKNEANNKPAKVPGSKRRKLNAKELQEMELESSDDEDGSKFISKLEKEILSCTYDSADNEDVIDELLTTSTPAVKKRRPLDIQSSPIHSNTPIKGTLFDDSFLDSLGEKKGLSPSFSSEYTEMKANDCPMSPLLDFEALPFCSPDKMHDGLGHEDNPNLSRILNELDDVNPETFPNLNWSVIQQMVDSMDTTESPDEQI
ncbi:uncharacterized protein LOC127879506 isoform X1 [Dreissena polymorpha]|uniref:Fork-head domain-containing protein n=1 Tax=Dreissena polymorpha TaxID=45954 RepID=A0A9D4HAH7_DREPO|nr:uncharacterized protein LOC127879506 isoform X1 [Dreissena polymorpha]KAH3830428.1 hypothetical protein DPMN_103672 [Dreissena polymorpha]